MSKYLGFAGHLESQEALEDVCLVLDVSPSMEATDYKPSRLEGAIHAAKSLLEVKRSQYPLDRVAIIGFSDRACVVHPLAEVGRGLDSLRIALDDIGSGQGTNITAGLQAAARVLRRGELEPVRRFLRWTSSLWSPQDLEPEDGSPRRASRIVLLGDGDHNSGPGPGPVSRELKDEGVVIDVIGIGNRATGNCFDEAELKRIASRNPDGTIRYCFIDDTEDLVKSFQTLAHHIKVMDSEVDR